MEVRKCIECGSPKIKEVVKDDKVHYECPDCGYDGATLFQDDGKAILEKTKDGKWKHYSIAAVVEKDGKVLLEHRRKFPFGYSIPAGHLEKAERDRTDEAIKREVKEETNLDVEVCEKLFELEHTGLCRRGAEVHHYYLFKCSGSGKLEKNDESHELVWVPVKELTKYNLTSSTRVLLEKAGYLSS
jgi:8-oxo-dGTP pyrophosphatase MutT (NUDIX family)